MIRIKTTDYAPAGACWNYGQQYMRKIDKRTARRLCDGHPLPDIGYELMVARGLGQSRLFVQNVSGDYYIASASDAIAHWPTTFGIEVIA